MLQSSITILEILTSIKDISRAKHLELRGASQKKEGDEPNHDEQPSPILGRQKDER